MRAALRAGLAALALAACAREPAPARAPAAPTPVATEAPAGVYELDPAHTSVLARADHIGFSMFTSRFTDVRARLALDPARPEAAQLSVDIGAASWTADNAPADFLAVMHGAHFFDVAQHPRIGFRSTAVALTGPDTAQVTGDLTLLGVTRPVRLDVRFNGGYAGHALEPRARIGFSATGTIKRSDFGMDFGLPPPGSNLGVFDAVEIVIETELLGPPLEQEAQP